MGNWFILFFGGMAWIAFTILGDVIMVWKPFTLWQTSRFSTVKLRLALIAVLKSGLD